MLMSPGSLEIFFGRLLAAAEFLLGSTYVGRDQRAFIRAQVHSRTKDAVI